MPVFECGTVWSPLAEGPFFNGTLVPRIQLAILKTSKIMSWPRLARPRDLVGSLVWRGDDRATEIFFLCPSGGLRSASESPCSACLTPYTQTCPACLPVLLCLLYVVLLFRMLGFLRAHQRASGASSGKRVTTPASATAAPSQRAAAERRCARSEQSSRACL